jgi:hypothetical protein
MGPVEIVTIANVILPHLFAVIGNIRSSQPELSYRETLELAGVKLDMEYAKLLEDMEQAVKDGAVPRTPPS